MSDENWNIVHIHCAYGAYHCAVTHVRRCATFGKSITLNETYEIAELHSQLSQVSKKRPIRYGRP